jgi:hypothetical protein
MELLRRAILLGCILPGLWLLRLTPLTPLLTISPAASGAQAAGNAGERTVPVSGTAWGSLLGDLDRLQNGQQPPSVHLRVGGDSSGERAQGRHVFFRPTDEPFGSIGDRIAAAGGHALVTIQGAGGDRCYRVDRHAWTSDDFRSPGGFTGTPTPPSWLLYPFQIVGLAFLLAGTVLFLLLPSPPRARGGGTAPQLALLVVAIVFFAGPLFAVGGSVQALTRGLWLTVPCWIISYVAMHFFAAPRRNYRFHLLSDPGQPSEEEADAAAHPHFVRVGLAFWAVAFGPAMILIATSMMIWNR